MAIAKLLTMAFFFMFTIIGTILCMGAYLKWKWLVDPDETYSKYYSQARIKKEFGKTFLLLYTYFLGIVFIILSVYFIVRVYKIPNSRWAF